MKYEPGFTRLEQVRLEEKTIDDKSASGIKNINFGFTHTLMFVSTVCSVLSLSPVRKYHRHVTRVGSEPMTLASSRAVSYQLDYPDCPVARGIIKMLPFCF